MVITVSHKSLNYSYLNLCPAVWPIPLLIFYETNRLHYPVFFLQFLFYNFNNFFNLILFRNSNVHWVNTSAGYQMRTLLMHEIVIKIETDIFVPHQLVYGRNSFFCKFAETSAIFFIT